MIIQNSNFPFLLILILTCISCSEEIKGPFNKWNLPELKTDPQFVGEKPTHKLDVDFIKEASGIGASLLNPGYFYVNNDSGSPSEVFMIDSLGHYCGKIFLEGTENRDWEELTTGPGPDVTKSYIYIADIGDNKTRHPVYFIYRLEDSKRNINPKQAFEARSITEKISFQYPHGKSHNCEAFIIDPVSKDIYLFTKGKRSTVFKLAHPQSLTEINTCTKVVTLPINKVTAADLSFNGSSILIKDYRNVYYWNKGSKSVEETLTNSKPKLLNYQIEAQGEAIAWSINGNSFYTLSEAENKPSQYLIRYNKK